MLIRWAEMYANTEILSPIDRETWRIIAKTTMIDPSSRVIELASGKGAFASYLAYNYGCRVDGFDINQEFIDYSNNQSRKLGLESRTIFTHADLRLFKPIEDLYDLGVCLGALYIFRQPGWNILTRAVRPEGCIAVSDLICKKFPPPKEIADVFFEEPGEPLSLQDAREWYTSRGMKIIREVECSHEAWIEYYDLQKKELEQISHRPEVSEELLAEVEEEYRQDRLVRKHREEYMDYVTFIMKKT